MSGKRKFYITTPIYYVNDVPHLGHVYTTVAADVLARYHRNEGEAVFFLTGTDEHGQKAYNAAKDKGQDVKAHVDAHSKVFADLWVKMGISNDRFIRTTEEAHVKVVQTILNSLHEKGEIYAADYEGWYCVPDERFWMEKDLVEGNCPECGRKVERILEKNYFFAMGKYQQWLVDHIKANEDFILPQTRRNEVLGFLEKKLDDLCISRPKSRMPWGVELPFDRDYVTYVWFDALLNYVTGPGYIAEPDRFAAFWPPDIHLIGKDILTTHSVYWMAMLKAAGLEVPKKIFAHGWWTVNGKKMSKSLGNTLAPEKVINAVGLDQFRYFLMKEVPFGMDGDFSADALISRVNVDLANNLGNLISRSLKMLEKYRGSRIPEPSNGPKLSALKEAAEGHMRNYVQFLGVPSFNRALDEMINLCDALNRFIVENEPWVLAKEEARSGELDDVLYGAAEALRLIGRMITPFMPASAEKLFSQLGIDPENTGADAWGGTRPGALIKAGEGIFPRIDEKNAEEMKKTLATGVERKPPVPEVEKVGFDDFKKLDLRTAVIVEAEAVPKSKKLLKIQVNLGYERRQIVAGIAEHYRPEEVIGRQVIIVANLAPAKIMGIESNGMLLAAHDNGKLVLTTTTGEAKGGLKVS